MGDPAVPEPSAGRRVSAAQVSAPAMPVIRWPGKYESDIPFVLADGLPRTIGWQWRSASADSPAFVIVGREKIGGYEVLQHFPLTQEGWASAWKSLAETDPAAAEKVVAALDGGETVTARRQWTGPDRINLVGVIIALAAFIVGVGVPRIIGFYHDHFQEPDATIFAPTDGQVLPTNRIGVGGTAEHIPADSDLWLSVSGSSDEVYPIAELQVKAGPWSASEKQVCFRIGPGPQRFDVWIAPDTNDGNFVAYMQKNGNRSGFSSVPAGFMKLSQITFRVRHVVNHCLLFNVRFLGELNAAEFMPLAY